MSSIDRFAEKAREELLARPILPFGARVALGAVGVLEENQFSPRGNVQSVLDGAVGEVSTGMRANWQLTSGRDVQVTFLADGQASSIFPNAPAAEAKVEISFGSQDSFFVSMSEITISTMTNPAELIARMLDAHDRGTWRNNYILVYEVIQPANALVLLSRQAESNFLLTAKAEVTAPQGSADIAGKFGVRFQNKDALQLDGGGQPLFFNAFRVKEDFFSGEIKVQPFGVDATAGVFERV